MLFFSKNVMSLCSPGRLRLLINFPCGFPAIDFIPIIGHTKPGTIGNRHASVSPNIVELICVVVCIDRGLESIPCTVRANQTQFIEVGVDDRSHTMAMERTRGVQLYLHTDCIAKVCELHRAGNTTIQLRINVHNVGAPGKHEVGFLFKTADVFRDQHGCFNEVT